MVVRHLYGYYGAKQVLSDVSLAIRERQITALIGPSGCGKSTFLRCLNRMNDTIRGARIEGRGAAGRREHLCARLWTWSRLRQRVGMVFQRPNPFPQSMYDNVAFGPRVLGHVAKSALDEIVEQSLRGSPVG